MTDLNLDKLRADFPILSEEIHGHPLAYLDNAATAQKPRRVLDAMDEFYLHHNSNIHRAVHTLGEQATHLYEQARQKVQRYINAAQSKECIFTRGTTEAINLVASSYGQKFVGKDDEIVITQLEHHSNLVPWHLLAERQGAKIKVIPLLPNGDLDLSNLDQIITKKAKIVALGHASNALGTVNPIKTIIDFAHGLNVPVLIDGAQWLPHMHVDVQALDCDFYAFSGHKLFGPTGIGVLYAKHDWLQEMPPYQGGGGMICQVYLDHSTFAPSPAKFEAGTPAIAEAYGLGCAIDYLSQLNPQAIAQHEQKLLHLAEKKLRDIPGLRIIGEAEHKISVVSFVMERIHGHDLATILDQFGVAVRAGHHCTMPAMDYFNVPATVRASFAFYNTEQEVDRLVEALYEAKKIFKQ